MELAPLTEALEPAPLETYEDQLNRVKDAAAKLGWIHVLGIPGVVLEIILHTCMSKNDLNHGKNNGNQGDWWT